MTCPKCADINELDATYCESCGAGLTTQRRSRCFSGHDLTLPRARYGPRGDCRECHNRYGREGGRVKHGDKIDYDSLTPDKVRAMPERQRVRIRNCEGLSIHKDLSLELWRATFTAEEFAYHGGGLDSE